MLGILGWAAAPADGGGDEIGLLNNPLLSPQKTVLIVAAVAVLIVTYYVMLIIVHWSKKHGGKSPMSDASFLDGVETKGGLTREELRRVREAYMRKTFPGDKPGAASKSGSTVEDLARMATLGSEGVGLAEKRQTPPPLPVRHTPTVPAADGAAQETSAAPAKAQPPRRHTAANLDEILVHHDAQGNAQAAAAGEGAPARFASDSAQSDAGAGSGLPTVDLKTGQPRRFAPDVSAPAEPHAPATEPPPLPAAPSAPPAGGGFSLDLDNLLARGLIAQEEYDRLRALAQQARSEESGASDNR
jgi:hypothetical protein